MILIEQDLAITLLLHMVALFLMLALVQVLELKQRRSMYRLPRIYFIRGSTMVELDLMVKLVSETRLNDIHNYDIPKASDAIHDITKVLDAIHDIIKASDAIHDIAKALDAVLLEISPDKKLPSKNK